MKLVLLLMMKEINQQNVVSFSVTGVIHGLTSLQIGLVSRRISRRPQAEKKFSD